MSANDFHGRNRSHIVGWLISVYTTPTSETVLSLYRFGWYGEREFFRRGAQRLAVLVA
jgi:hypothetical protein